MVRRSLLHMGLQKLSFVFCQRLSFRFAVWIKVGPLADTDHSIAEALPKTFVVECSGMKDTAIVPNSYKISN